MNLPTYLVSEYALSSQHLNSLLTVSRIASILFILRAGIIIKCTGKRRTVVSSLFFPGLLTVLIALANGDWVHIVVVAQPTLLVGFMFAAVLNLLATPDFGGD